MGAMWSGNTLTPCLDPQLRTFLSVRQRCVVEERAMNLRVPKAAVNVEAQILPGLRHWSLA